MKPDYLTQMQYDVLLRTFAPFADRVERVDVYGSRARGTHRTGSDIDLIVAGDAELEDVLRMAVALEESDLSIFADIQRYSDTLTPSFAREVARDAKTLFTRAELLAAHADTNKLINQDGWWS